MKPRQKIETDWTECGKQTENSTGECQNEKKKIQKMKTEVEIRQDTKQEKIETRKKTRQEKMETKQKVKTKT